MLKPMSHLLLEVTLNEMAKRITDKFISQLTSDPEINSRLYHDFSKIPVIHDMGNGISLHARVGQNGSASFATLDHHNRRAIHVTNIRFKQKSDVFPHDNIEQELVDKDSKHPIGNSQGYARNFAYTHWMSQDLPLRSSSEQMIGGHKMWRKYSKQALDDGKFVYYHSPETGFVRLNHENLDEYHSRYFGTDDSHLNRSLVLSHTAL